MVSQWFGSVVGVDRQGLDIFCSVVYYYVDVGYIGIVFIVGYSVDVVKFFFVVCGVLVVVVDK